MKYSKSNPPMTCMMTQSSCYKGTEKMTVKGILWHSTGANNPTLKRYVQPDDNAADRAELLSKLGTNANKNDWNHTNVQAGLNAWIGSSRTGVSRRFRLCPGTLGRGDVGAAARDRAIAGGFSLKSVRTP